MERGEKRVSMGINGSAKEGVEEKKKAREKERKEEIGIERKRERPERGGRSIGGGRSVVVQGVRLKTIPRVI